MIGFVAKTRIGLLAAAFGLALTLGGCQGRGPSLGVFGGSSTPETPEAAAERVERLGQIYERDPNDRRKALAYSAALRTLGRTAQALAVIEATAMRYPGDKDVLGAYGKVLVDAGRARQAEEVLSRAHSPERPDWTILSAQGIAADQLGDHDRARKLYASALTLMPEEPAVLTNLGLSHAMSGDLPAAETALRRAAARPEADKRVRQNLALVLGLAGKTQEALSVARQDMTAEDAAAFVDSLKPRKRTDAWSMARQGRASPRIRPVRKGPNRPKAPRSADAALRGGARSL